MEALGLDSELMQQRFLLVVGGVFLLFFVLSPIAGRLVHRGTQRLLPGQETIALLAAGFVVFAFSFAISLGLLLRAVPGINPLFALLMSFGGALLVTLAAAVAVSVAIRRIDPTAAQFGVWGEDVRKRPKNLRRR